nr:NifB/NifX family molybdenum-iron cluster-binding protein [uncultured Tolumonas sp.]
MITAIPMNKDHVASHFTKADSFVFLDDNGQILGERNNPALDANCAGKSQLLALLKAENAQRIIVRNIGERMLGKLLESQFDVFQTQCGRQSATELSSEKANLLTQLTSPSQGRQSRHFEEKQASGGCGCQHGEMHECHHQHDHPEQQRCCHKKHDAEHLSAQEKRCCRSV